MDFEEITKRLGDFGTYQQRLYFLLCIIAAFAGIQVMMTVFTFGIPDHRCAIIGLENDTYSSNVSTEFEFDNKLYGQCLIFQLSPGNKTVLNTTKCDTWVYDKSIFETSLISEMDIVCDDKIGKSHAQMLMMLGAVTGCALVGPLSDLFGRKSLLCVFVIIHIITSITLTWAPTIRVAFALYFFLGASINGSFTPAFVLAMELVGPKKRVFTGIVIELFWCGGTIILSGAAHWIRNREHLQLALSVPSLFLLSYFWCVTESPRWLINKGKFKEAEKIIRHAAKVNKVELPNRLFSRSKSRTKEVESYPMTALCTSRILVCRSLIIYINWAACSVTFYGLSLNAGNLSGSVHLNFFLLFIIEIPAYLFCLLLLDRVGRKYLHCFSLLLCGSCLMLSIFPILYADKSLQWITTVLAVIGKMSVTAAFGILWLYTSELYPTVLRNSGVGSSSLVARGAAAISPYIANLESFIQGDIGRVTPLIIFGLSSIVAALLALFLPETKGRKLPETVADIESFEEKKSQMPYHGEELKVLSVD